MSRKLIFVSGLLACFSFHLLLSLEEQQSIIKSHDSPYEFIRHLRKVFSQTPLEILAAAINRFPHLHKPGAKLFQAYDHFIAAVGNADIRLHLKGLSVEAASADETYNDLRKISHQFRDNLLELFFDELSGLANLTRLYGVF